MVTVDVVALVVTVATIIKDNGDVSNNGYGGPNMNLLPWKQSLSRYAKKGKLEKEYLGDEDYQ
eukprot:4412499-Ditylum_brightwellii.AAC.1